VAFVEILGTMYASFLFMEIILLFMLTCRNLLVKSPVGDDLKSPLYEDVSDRVGYNMIPIRTLSILVYFTYIFIDIIIYALGIMLGSSGIFWMVGRVIADPSLNLLSLYEVVPWVPILVSTIKSVIRTSMPHSTQLD
jgi:hypothetical protein